MTSIRLFLKDASRVACAASKYNSPTMARVRIEATKVVNDRIAKLGDRHSSLTPISPTRAATVIDGLASAAWAMLQQHQLAVSLNQWPPRTT